jgi:nicotinate-nucleotide--dimethylbenzimidazole phosphoribosyltransferase
VHSTQATPLSLHLVTGARSRAARQDGHVHLPPIPSPDAEARRADHGVAAAGVSAYPSYVTARRVVGAREHTTPVAVLALAAGVSLRVVDVAVDHSPDAPAPDSPLAPDPRYRVGAGTGRIDRTDALTEEETERALAVGRALVDEEVDGGADLLVPGAIGVGATTPASVLVAAVTGAEPVAVVGRGSGIDDETWMRKAAAIRDALRRARPHARDPLALLRVAGGADIAVLTGFLVQAAVRRTPVLLDGLVPVTAALIADEWAPGARDWWLLAQRSPEPALALAAEHLELTPVLDLQMRLDDGSGAVAAVPLLAMAARLLAETGTAADTGITPIAHAGV